MSDDAPTNPTNARPEPTLSELAAELCEVRAAVANAGEALARLSTVLGAVALAITALEGREVTQDERIAALEERAA